MKDISGYEGLYAVTEDGQVWGYKSKRFLTPIQEWTGYYKVNLSKNGKVKAYKVHRLVLETFNPVDNMPSLDIDHIDENKGNNALANLRWKTHQENCNSGSRNQRIRKTQGTKVYCKETNTVYDSMREAAEALGLPSGSGISAVCRGIQKQTHGYHFSYAAMTE